MATNKFYVFCLCDCVNTLNMADPHCDECEGTGQVEDKDYVFDEQELEYDE